MVSHLPPPPCLKNPHPQMASERTVFHILGHQRKASQKSTARKHHHQRKGDWRPQLQGRVRTGGLIAAGQQAGVLLATLEVSVEAR